MYIDELIETTLNPVLPCFGGVPDFGNNEPNTYCTYILTERPSNYGDGEYKATEWLISLNVISPTLDHALYKKIKKALKVVDISFYSGNEVKGDGSFSQTTQYALDFVYVEGEEDE